MSLCNFEKVDQIRNHVRQLMAQNKRESRVEHKSEHKEAQGAAIELEPVGSDAGQASLHHPSSAATPDRPLVLITSNWSTN